MHHHLQNRFCVQQCTEVYCTVLPTLPLCSAAAVASLLTEAPRKTPCCQEMAWYTRGTPRGLRPPNKMADTGTPVTSQFPPPSYSPCYNLSSPLGSSQAGSRLGQFIRGEQNLELGWAAGVDTLVAFHGLPLQSVQLRGLSPIPSHHTPPSSVIATLVNTVSLKQHCHEQENLTG